MKSRLLIWRTVVQQSMEPWFHLTYPLCCVCRVFLFGCDLNHFRSSVVDQVAQFNKYLAPRPAGATWSSTNSLFAVWIGINDVVRIFAQTRVFRIMKHIYSGKLFRLGGSFSLCSGWEYLSLIGLHPDQHNSG